MEGAGATASQTIPSLLFAGTLTDGLAGASATCGTDARGGTYPFPLGVDDLRGYRGVGVVPRELDAVEVCDPLCFPLDAQDGLTLLVGVGQGGLELVVSSDESLQEMGSRLEPGARFGELLGE